MSKTPEPTMTSPDAATGDARAVLIASRMSNFTTITERRVQAQLEDTVRPLVDRDIAALAKAGYRIVRATPDAGGAVTITFTDDELLDVQYAMKQLFASQQLLAHPLRAMRAEAKLYAAIAAGQGGRDGEAE